MRTIKTTVGTPVELDGDVLAVLEAISRDLTRQKALDYDFEDVEREFQHFVGQMTEAEIPERLDWLLGGQKGPAPKALVKHLAK